MDEVGFRIPPVGFRIPRTGFRIPKPRIPDSKGKKMLDSGFRIPLHGAKKIPLHKQQATKVNSHANTTCNDSNEMQLAIRAKDNDSSEQRFCD